MGPHEMISALTSRRETSESLCCLSSPCENTERRWLSASQQDSLSQNQTCQHPNLVLQPPELWENKLLLLTPPAFGTLLQQPEKAKIMSVIFLEYRVSTPLFAQLILMSFKGGKKVFFKSTTGIPYYEYLVWRCLDSNKPQNLNK